MSLHDEYARITPHELAFRSREAAEAFVAEVDEEASGRGAHPGEPHAFVTMGAADRFVRELADGDPSPEALLRYGALAFHGYHFARAGWPLYLLTVDAARHLVAVAPTGSAGPPSAAGYLQLPQHLFWADLVGGSPQSVDGIHWALGPRGDLHSLLVTGVRADAAGLGVVTLPEAPFGEASAWLDADVRGDGSDYRSDMEGAELDGLHSFTTAGEVLKLLARFFCYASTSPASLVAGERGEPRGEADPRPTALGFDRVLGPH